MSKQQRPEPPRDEFADWIAEADAKAAEAVAKGARLDRGTVVGADPRLRYSVCDGELPQKAIARFRLKMEANGFREIAGAEVVGYNKAIVYAMPMEVYTRHIGQRRLDTARQLAARYPKQVAVYGPQVR